MGGCISRKKRRNSPGYRKAAAVKEFPNSPQFLNHATPYSNGLLKHESAKITNNKSPQENSSSTTNKADEENRNPASIAPVPFPRTKSQRAREKFAETNIANNTCKIIQKEKCTDKITPFNTVENSQLVKKESNVTEREIRYQPMVQQKYVDAVPSSNSSQCSAWLKIAYPDEQLDYNSNKNSNSFMKPQLIGTIAYPNEQRDYNTSKNSDSFMKPRLIGTIAYPDKQGGYNTSKNSDSFMKPKLVHEDNFVQLLYKQPLHTFTHQSLKVSRILHYNELEFGTPAYNKIRNKFAETGKRSMDIISIDQIVNPYIQMLYKLKKSEMESRMNVTERLLFHGTTRDRIESICSNNFDHRLSGTATGSKFGKGMSFSPISFYATHYCDKKSKVKVMLLCKVLVGDSHFGNKFTYIPNEGFDTTTNHNRHVIVKYDDDVYCPEYVIHFQFN